MQEEVCRCSTNTVAAQGGTSSACQSIAALTGTAPRVPARTSPAISWDCSGGYIYLAARQCSSATSSRIEMLEVSEGSQRLCNVKR